MERISGDKKVQLLEEFTKDTGLKLCVGNRTQYTEWLEYRLVKKLPIQRVSKRSELFDLLDWMQYENEFDIGDINEILDDYEYYKANCC